MEASKVRQIVPTDYDLISPVLDDWWGGRPVRDLLQRLFFEHFGPTSFFVGTAHDAEAFLIGFLSQSDSHVGYIHFVGVKPSLRGGGLGRMLYERFFAVTRALGCRRVECITSPVNTGSVAFHRRMGFELVPSSVQINGLPVFADHSGPGQHRIVFTRALEGEASR